MTGDKIQVLDIYKNLAYNPIFDTC